MTSSSLEVFDKQSNFKLTFPCLCIRPMIIFSSPSNYRTVSAYQSMFLVIAWQFPFTESFTNYRIWLKAFTWKNEGSPSEQLSLKTDVAGPPSPLITNLTCADERFVGYSYKIASALFQFKMFNIQGVFMWSGRVNRPEPAWPLTILCGPARTTPRTNCLLRSKTLQGTRIRSDTLLEKF